MPRAQLAASAGKRVVSGFAALDEKLESVGVLPELTPQPVPAEVADEDGVMHNDRVEARLLTPHTRRQETRRLPGVPAWHARPQGCAPGRTSLTSDVLHYSAYLCKEDKVVGMRLGAGGWGNGWGGG